MTGPQRFCGDAGRCVDHVAGEHYPAAGAAGAFVVVNLESEGFEHPTAHGIGECRDLTSSGWQCVDEGWVLPDGCLSPVAGDLCFLGLDLIIEFGDPHLNPLDEPAVGVIGEFEGVELALAPFLEVRQGVVEGLVSFCVLASFVRVGLGQCGSQ
ncbi:hypothetical protein [Streptomyces coffeae]|uniref:Uncharacterized protein n=1 Tax=Streptomyces coffeae TaxID=621382 RepID=A0ABS1NG80_9ACTN|nr:hypothetical protein [Streptomyces coffeae]MBL1098932.1 hypothetical protein [Streptomyces coffeae]